MPTDFAPHDLTANGSHPPYFVSASTFFSASFAPYKAFDNGAGSAQYWAATTDTGWLRIHVGQRRILNSYSIRVNTIPEPNRAPKNWTMQGSNDRGASWDTLDTVTGETSWSSGETRTFTCDTATTEYEEFRLNVTLNNGDGLLAIAELSLLTDGTPTYSNQAPNNMSGASVPSPFVASDSGHFSTLAGWKSFDGLHGNNNCVLTGTSGWVKLDIGVGNSALIQSYSIGQRDSEATRAPNSWTLEGSNDDTNWDTLDTVTGQASWADDETRSFTVDVVTTGYRYFRLSISANNGDGSFTDLTELYLWGGPPPAPPFLSVWAAGSNQVIA